MGKEAQSDAGSDNEARQSPARSAQPAEAQPGCGCLIRGKKVDKALADLTFSRKRIAARPSRRR
jgi:ribosomal protein L22